MKLTVVVQGFKGSSPVAALEAGAFLVRRVLINGQEVAAEKFLLDCTPGNIFTFTLSGASPMGDDGFDPDACTELWAADEGSLAGSPLEVEFLEESREVPR